jgi:putative iron-dependent peroxidase
MTGAMATPQTGIFALGTASHGYLELDLRPGVGERELVEVVARIHGGQTTVAGANLVCGFRPGLWRRVSPREIPSQVAGFDRPIVGADGFTMPATQHDAVLWFSASGYDVVFDATRAGLVDLTGVAAVAEETAGWSYRHDRDLTGFVDGTENPSPIDAAAAALVPPGTPGAGGSVLLLQRWVHDARAWEALAPPDQERAMGRTKAESRELDPQVPDSHVSRTDQESFGHIWRRNTAYGTVTDHGTMFVGFSAEQRRLEEMLASMAGSVDGVRDALTRYTRPVTGAFYFIPSIEALHRFATGPGER